MKAVIDLGTNTFKYVVARVTDNTLDIILDGALSVRLGEKLDATGSIGIEAMLRGCDALTRILALVRAQNPDKITCVGSMALRTATDAGQFINLVKNSFDLKVNIISGQEEAELAWIAATYGVERNHTKAVLDIGGGSAELIFGREAAAAKHSFPLGAVSLTNRFISSDPPNSDELQRIKDYTDAQLSSVSRGQSQEVLKLIAIGGSAVNLAAMQFYRLNNPEPDLESYLEDAIISEAELNQLVSLLCAQDLATRKTIPGLSPDRADIIISGAIVLQRVLNYLNLKEFGVNTRGIRHGILIRDR